VLRITSRDVAHEHLLKLEGCLAGAWVPELARCWREANVALASRRVTVDLTDVCHVDDAGRELMTLMYRAGVRFVARGFVMPQLVREIAEAVDDKRRN
jgi:ABC-type transporter Mla MlaB component